MEKEGEQEGRNGGAASEAEIDNNRGEGSDIPTPRPRSAEQLLPVIQEHEVADGGTDYDMDGFEDDVLEDSGASVTVGGEAARTDGGVGDDAGDSLVQGVEQILQEGGELLQRLRSDEAEEVAKLLTDRCESPIARILQEQIAKTSPVRDKDETPSGLADGIAHLIQEGSTLLGRLASDEAKEVSSLVANRSGSPVARALVAEISKSPVRA